MQPDRGRPGTAIKRKRHRSRAGITDPVDDVCHEEHLRHRFPLGRIELVLHTLFGRFFAGIPPLLSLFDVSNKQVTSDRFVIEYFASGQRNGVFCHHRRRRLIFALVPFLLLGCGLLFNSVTGLFDVYRSTHRNAGNEGG